VGSGPQRINARVDGRRLLVLGAGPAQLGLLRTAREAGAFVVACDRDPGAVGFRYADRRALVSTEDEASIVRLARAERVEGIVAPGIDWPVGIAARTAALLGLPHPISPETAALSVSKLRQRERFAERGVPQPVFRLVASPAEAVSTPCVIKPPDRQGQRGLTIVLEAAAVAGAIELALAESRSGVAIAEELVDGPEVTVNAFSVAGEFHPLTVTDRLTADPPAFGVALAHAWPSARADEAIVAAAKAAAEAVGLADGPTYTQIRVTPDGPRVMELAARLGGGHDGELCRVALSVDLNRLALAAALGEQADMPPPEPNGGACVRFLVPPEGELQAVHGLVEARSAEGVVDAEAYRGPGWRFGPFRRGGDRAGYVLARGASRDHALAQAAEAMAMIRFEVATATAPA
jgi:biotin carboxylase